MNSVLSILLKIGTYLTQKLGIIVKHFLIGFKKTSAKIYKKHPYWTTAVVALIMFTIFPGSLDATVAGVSQSGLVAPVTTLAIVFVGFNILTGWRKPKKKKK